MGPRLFAGHLLGLTRATSRGSGRALGDLPVDLDLDSRRALGLEPDDGFMATFIDSFIHQRASSLLRLLLHARHISSPTMPVNAAPARVIS